MDEEIHYPKETDFKVKKPDKFQTMLDISRRLSKPFPHARIDFYYINKTILIGEITFFHQSGMMIIKPQKFNYELGNEIDLSNLK